MADDEPLHPPYPLHPLHGSLTAAIAALPAGPAATALGKFLEHHRPVAGSPERDWVVCAECAVLSWPPPADRNSMWSDAVYPCLTVLAVAGALDLPETAWNAERSPSPTGRPRRWRTGRRNPRNVYEQCGDQPSDDDLSIGMLDTADLARLAVEAVNAGFGVQPEGGEAAAVPPDAAPPA